MKFLGVKGTGSRSRLGPLHCHLGALPHLLPNLASSQIRAHATSSHQFDSVSARIRAAVVAAIELSGFWLQLCQYESFKFRNLCYVPVVLDIMFLFLNVKIIHYEHVGGDTLC